LANFLDQLVKIRRLLRDPDALIWDNEQLCLLWNEAQTEIAQKTGYLTRARSVRYPSQYSVSYMFDFEPENTPGDNPQPLRISQSVQNLSAGTVITYPWEAGYNHTTNELPDDGYRITHLWEAGYASTVGDPPWVQLSGKIQGIKFAMFDEDTITPIYERTLALSDGAWRTHQGDAQHYYLSDQYHNRLYLYPQPDITLDDDPTAMTYYILTQDGETIETQDGDILSASAFTVFSDYSYTHDWENTNSHAGVDPQQFGHEFTASTSSTVSYIHSFDWEYAQLNGDTVSGDDPDTYKFMRYWEYYGEGTVLSFWPSVTNEYDTGDSNDLIGTEGQLFLVYDYLPADVEDYAETITDWPPYLFKAIISGTLERAYSANTDGFIPSLRDFWRMRKEYCIRAITMLKRGKLKDRDFRLGGAEQYKGQSSHPRLPSHFPRQEI
jgi:hypothetical protein